MVVSLAMTEQNRLAVNDTKENFGQDLFGEIFKNCLKHDRSITVKLFEIVKVVLSFAFLEEGFERASSKGLGEKPVQCWK